VITIPVELTLPEGPVRATYKTYCEDKTALEMMWVGGVGCSKSDALVTRVGFIADAYPKGRTVVARSDSVKLASTTLRKFLEKWDHGPEVGTFHQQDGEWKLPLFRWANGHITLFIGLGDHKAVARLKSMEVIAVAFDEADEIEEDTWNMALGRIRQQLPGVTPHYSVFGVANYEGRNWIWRRFKADFANNPKNKRRLLEASTFDNLSLPPTYIDTMRLNGDQFMRRYVYGSWDTASGLIFPEFNERLHSKPIPQPLPQDWHYVVGIDHGLRNPTAATLWGIDAQGTWHGVREYYERGLSPAQNARALKLWAADVRVSSWVIDPSTFNSDPRQPGESIAFDYQKEGISVARGNNNLETGIARVRSLLQPITGSDGEQRARAYVDPAMSNFIREMQEWKWRDLRSGQEREVAEDKNDHAPDSFRYAVMHVPEGFRSGPAKSAFKWADEDDDDQPRNKPRKSIGGY
jgi:hypothetical protein